MFIGKDSNGFFSANLKNTGSYYTNDEKERDSYENLIKGRGENANRGILGHNFTKGIYCGEGMISGALF
ncbi:MAG: hypothetical protein LBV22_01175 [Mycoplasmataceae bacterium]|nr:hypothetical protein [Mycoplasmataceae bacterium]